MVGYRLILIIGSLLIIFILVMNIKGEAITVGKLIILFITLIVALVLWQTTGQLAGSACGAVG